jgi:hypothetical protein
MIEECCVCKQNIGFHFFRDEEGKPYHFLCAEKELGVKFEFNQDKMRMEIKNEI